MTPSKMEVRWAIELFSSTFPATREAPLGAAGVPMGAFYRDQIQACPPSVAMAYRLSVAALWWMGPLVLGRFGSFRRLSLEERERCLMKLYASPVYAIRQTVTLLKVIVPGRRQKEWLLKGLCAVALNWIGVNLWWMRHWLNKCGSGG